MITDIGLRLAAAEVTPGAGAGGIGAASAALNLDLSSIGNALALRNMNSIGDGQKLMLDLAVTTSFACAGTAITTMEFQLISMPIAASLLTNASGSGKKLARDAVGFLIATDEFTIAGHNLPLGTPIHLTNITGGPGNIAVDTVYYVVPTGANTFKLATSLANAVASTPTTINIITSNGDATVNFIPTVHASTGQLPMFNTPINASPLRSGSRIQVPIRPLADLSPTAVTPTAQTSKKPWGAGPDANLLAANAQRYYHLRYLPANTITAGAINANIVVDAGDPLNYPQTGVEIIG